MYVENYNAIVELHFQVTLSIFVPDGLPYIVFSLALTGCDILTSYFSDSM